MAGMSQAQSAYLRKRSHDRWMIKIWRILLFLLFLGAWEGSSRAGWLDSFIFSSPSQVWSTFISMCRSHSLFLHIGVTLYETLVSFVLVLLLGLTAAVLLWAFPRVSHILEPYLVVLNSLPKSALAPLLIVWLGANRRTIVVAGISVAVFGSVISLYSGFLQVDKEKIKLIETLGGGKKDALFKVVLPFSIPLILSVMKVNIGLCLVGVIIGEFIGAREGLGYLIIYGSQVFKLDWVIMAIVILCILATMLYGILNFVEKLYQRRG